MKLPRIPLPQPETMSGKQREVYDDIVRGPRGSVKGPLLAALHSPELADRWQRLGEQLRYRTSLPQRHTEMVILVTARANNCAFEWHAHEPFARRAGLEPEFIDAIRKGETPRFVEQLDGSVHDFALQLQQTRSVSAGTYEQVLRKYGPLGVVELTALVGYYTMVAMTLNAHEISVPEGQPHPFVEPTGML